MATYFKYFFRVLSAIVISTMTMHISERGPFKQNFRKFWVEHLIVIGSAAISERFEAIF